jgi:hypothetical protein
MSRSLGLAARPTVCLVALVAALHLVLTPVLAQEATPQPRPIASPAPAPALLDLAAMTLTPTDLADVGLSGFTVADGRTQSLDDRIAMQAAEGVDPQALRTYLTEVGWTRQYRSRLARATTPGEEEFDLLILSDITQYADAQGAATMFPVVSQIDVRAGAATPVADARPIGDQSLVLSVAPFETSDGTTAHGTRVFFRHGALIGDVIALADAGVTVSVEIVRTLAARLFQRVDAVLAAGGPGLSLKVLRLQGIYRDDPDVDNYLRLAGEAYVGLGDADDEVARDAATYADASDFYRYEAMLTSSLHQTVSLAEFPSNGSASTWLQQALVRAEANRPPGATVDVVADAPGFGEESVVLALAASIDGHQYVGYNVYARQGNQVVSFGLISLGDLPFATFLELAAMQVACFEGDGCPESAPLPPGLA